MRIVIDAEPLAVRSGGIRRYTQRLLEGLARIDTENEYVLYGADGHAGGLALGANFACGRQRWRAEKWIGPLRPIGVRGTIDLFHGTNYGAPVLGRFPTVVTVHDLTVKLLPDTHPPLRRLRHRLLPLHCRQAVRVIADSESTRRDLVRHLAIDAGKIDVVHLAVGKEFQPVSVAERERVRTLLALPERFVLYLGAVESRKNLSVLLRAMAALHREGRPQRLVVAGAGGAEQVAALRREAGRLGLEADRDVVFTGHVGEQDLPGLYGLAEVFVYPSRYEGFGLPPLEAMACGVPAVLSDDSSLGEVFADCGILVDTREPDGLADGMRRVLDDDGFRRERIEAGLARSRGRSWEDVAAQTLGIYRRAARGR